MKFFSAISTVVAIAVPVMGIVNEHKDRAYSTRLGNTMWHFSTNGLNIFSPDGSANLKSYSPDEVCHNYTSSSSWRYRCDWYDVVSDGKKYVYAAVTRGSKKLDVFDIDNGNFIGAIDTCENPRDLEYHALRDEVWVRCSKGTSEESHMDVINSNGLFSDSVSTVTVSNSTGNAYGYTTVDATLGDVGYVTDRSEPNLMKIDLNRRTLVEKIPLNPLNSGTYETAYSKVNKHLYIRSTVCCTCGFPGADKGEDCGRYGADNVTVLVGPNADPNKLQSGQCGHRCDGLDGIDILGVFEYDTVADKSIMSWTMDDGKAGDPFPSPSGEFIILFGRNGGKTIRILKTGKNGERSTIYADVSLGFNQTGVEDDQVYNDFAFVEKDDKKIVVFASSTENKISIVDLTGTAPTQSIVTFSDAVETSSYRNRRQVEWAAGTDYVWVDGTEANEVYVIDIEQKKVVTTIKDVSTTAIVNVNNWRHSYFVKEEAARINSMQPQAIFQPQQPYKDDNDIDTVGIIGLTVGALALVMGAMNLFMFAQVKKFMADTKKGNTNSTPNDDEEVTLGSKNVA